MITEILDRRIENFGYEYETNTEPNRDPFTDCEPQPETEQMNKACCEQMSS